MFDKLLSKIHLIKCPVCSTILVRGDAIILLEKVEGVVTNVL